jgi:hypothetical protein
VQVRSLQVPGAEELGFTPPSFSMRAITSSRPFC